jgi:5-methylcytosine-specific restriction endonuclease McrA
VTPHYSSANNKCVVCALAYEANKYHADIDKSRAQKRARHTVNPEVARAADRRRADDPIKRAHRNAQACARRASSRDAVNTHRRALYAADPAKILARQHAGRIRNHGRVLVQEREAKVRQRAADPDKFLLGARLRSHRHRARRASLLVGPVDEAQMIANFGNICFICEHFIDTTLPRGGRGHRQHPMSMWVEHIWPEAKGGAHTAWNTAPTHAACNMNKSDWLSPTMVRRAMQRLALNLYPDIYEQMAATIAQSVRHTFYEGR